MKVSVRKIHKVGSSYMIALPIEFVKANDLSEHQSLPVIYNSHHIVIVAFPNAKAKEVLKDATSR